MPEKILCCGKEAVKKMSPTTGLYSVTCTVCGRTGEAKKPEWAIAQFNTAKPVNEKPQQKAVALPDRPTDLPRYLASRMTDLSSIAVPFIARDKPALTRLIKNNIRYVMRQTSDEFQRAWSTEDGQKSIIYALEEALSLGAELGKMGSLVPFGGVVEFIPAVEAYEFALTNGENAPFKWVNIDMVYENDIVEISRKDGTFECKWIKTGFPRGELVGVVVSGFNNRLAKVIGEAYDVSRLLQKAKVHSSSYRYYLRDREAFERARAEGSVKFEFGNEYIEKQIPKRGGGGTWTKKIFYDEITNPYEGPDQPEMLRKAAGKSFLAKYAKIRNAEAAMAEVRAEEPDQHEELIDRTIDAAFASYEDKKDSPPPPEEPADEPEQQAPAAGDSEDEAVEYEEPANPDDDKQMEIF